MNCLRCDCPLVILWRIYDGQRRGVERRTFCVRCHAPGRHPLAVPCAMRGCVGAVIEAAGRFCPNCRKIRKSLKDKAWSERNKEKKQQQIAEWQKKNRERQQAHNRASYHKHREQRLAKRRERRKAMQSKGVELQCYISDTLT